MRYLTSPDTLHKVEEDELFSMPSRLTLQKTARALLHRLYSTEEEPNIPQAVCDVGTALEDQLEQSIALATKSKSITGNGQNEYKSIAKELLAFEA